MVEKIRLGVNVDHIATLRQARGTVYPDPVEAALVAISAGADSITVHLREDRRHIQDHDVLRAIARCPAPINLEMAVTEEMVAFALKAKPKFVCLVPEKREEKTTEGGLDVVGNLAAIKSACQRLGDAGIVTALFIDADAKQLQAAVKTGAPQLEIHTGRYADATSDAERMAELSAMANFAQIAQEGGFEVHAGHGLTVENVGPVAAIAPIVELNIGHSLVARAAFIGMAAAVAEMRRRMIEARAYQ